MQAPSIKAQLFNGAEADIYTQIAGVKVCVRTCMPVCEREKAREAQAIVHEKGYPLFMRGGSSSEADNSPPKMSSIYHKIRFDYL